MSPKYEIRAALPGDESRLLELARFLNTVNLPNDPHEIAALLERSRASFAQTIPDYRLREYVFLLVERESKRALGTSLIIAQLGRRDAPYIYFEVRIEERYSGTLDRHFVHQVLRIGYSYNGPTEIGGLVVHPEARRLPEKLGMLISYVRFLFLALHRKRFQPRVLAELLPPLEPDGTSHLWEAVGRHFTGLSYREADRLSKQNKEFIRGLFPAGDIYVSLLPPQAQAVIGRVGAQTRGVEKLLQRIGFRYWNRVDPFDGGPHFVADMDEISLIRRAFVGRAEIREPRNGVTKALVAVEREVPPYFLAVPALIEHGAEQVCIDSPTARALDVRSGERLCVLPLD